MMRGNGRLDSGRMAREEKQMTTLIVTCRLVMERVEGASEKLERGKLTGAE